MHNARTHFENQQKASWLKANPLVSRWVAGYGGFVELLYGNYQIARRILPDAIAAALEYHLQTPNLNDGWMFLEAQARLELLDGHFEHAALFFGCSLKERVAGDAEGEYPLTEFERPELEARIAEVRTAMEKTAFDAAFQKGQSLSLKDALMFAVEE